MCLIDSLTIYLPTPSDLVLHLLNDQEHGGDLNEAVNAYFGEGDRTKYVEGFP